MAGTRILVLDVRMPGLQLAAILLAIVVAMPVPAADEERPPTSSQSQAGPWQPAAPPVDDPWDWVQLVSGEWLKGTLEGLSNDELEFDSDKLGYLTIEWEDVRALRTARPMAIFYGFDEIAVGRLSTEDGRLVVDDATGIVRTDFFDVQSIAPGTPGELQRWSGRVGVGASFRSGNIEETDASANIRLRRRTAKTILGLDYRGEYSKVEGEETANSHSATASFDVRRTARSFWRPLGLSYYRDPFQNISSRVTYSTGIGYFVFDTPDLEWVISGGPAYQHTRFVNVEPGEDDSASTPALVLATSLDYELNTRTDLYGGYHVILANEDSGSFQHHFELTFELDLTKRLDLDVSWVWDRIESPQPDETGEVPERDDYRMSVGLSLEF